MTGADTGRGATSTEPREWNPGPGQAGFEDGRRFMDLCLCTLRPVLEGEIPVQASVMIRGGPTLYASRVTSRGGEGWAVEAWPFNIGPSATPLYRITSPEAIEQWGLGHAATEALARGAELCLQEYVRDKDARRRTPRPERVPEKGQAAHPQAPAGPPTGQIPTRPRDEKLAPVILHRFLESGLPGRVEFYGPASDTGPPKAALTARRNANGPGWDLRVDDDQNNTVFEARSDLGGEDWRPAARIALDRFAALTGG